MKFRFLLILILFVGRIHLSGNESNLNENKNLIDHQDDISVILNHGFFGFKFFDLFVKRMKLVGKKVVNDKKAKICLHMMWGLIRGNIKVRVKRNKTIRTYSLKPFAHEYSAYFIPMGSDDYPGINCILRRVCIFSLGYGFEFEYKCRKRTFGSLSHNISFNFAILAKSIIPFDLIISYSPVILQHRSGFYCELSLINISLGEFVNNIVMCFKKYDRKYDSRWPGAQDKDRYNNIFEEKCSKLQNNEISKLKHILYDGLFWNMIYNIRLNLGFLSIKDSLLFDKLRNAL